MNIKINGKLLLAILVSIIIFFIALYLNEIEHSDAIYTSLYYLPIIIVGLWYYRFVIPLAIIYSLQFCILDYINLGSTSIDQIIRGLVMITGSVIMYYLGQRLNKKNKELEISRSTLAIEKEHLRITLQSIGDGVISTDYNGNVIMFNEVAKNLTGWLGDTAVGRPFAEVFEIINEFSREKGENIVNNVLESGKIRELANHTILISKDGIERPIEDSAAPIRDRNGNIHGVILIFRDVTERKQVEVALRTSDEKYRLITEFASDVIWVLNMAKKRMTYVSPSVFQLRGFTPEEAMNQKVDEIFTPESSVIAQKVIKDYINIFIKSPEAPIYRILELQQSCKNGKTVWVEDTGKLRYNSDHEIEFVGVSRNIENRKKTEEQILYISYHDQLTGLYNRRFYEEELKRLDTKRNLPMTIAMGDVNGLKLINDSFGHAMGDELLRKAAEVIKNECRADDIIARLGGDEFVIILPKTDGFEAEQIIKRIQDLASKEKVGSLYISISFGYETKTNEEENIQEVFKNAEDHMYKRKIYESSSTRSNVIGLIINTLYEKSNREMLHSKRVSEICEDIATKMNFGREMMSIRSE